MPVILQVHNCRSCRYLCKDISLVWLVLKKKYNLISALYYTREESRGAYYKEKTVKIIRSGLEGENATVLTEFNSTQVTSLAVYLDFLYWVDLSYRSIRRLVNLLLHKCILPSGLNNTLEMVHCIY